MIGWAPTERNQGWMEWQSANMCPVLACLSRLARYDGWRHEVGGRDRSDYWTEECNNMLTFDSYESGGVLILTVEDSGYNAPTDRQASNREWLYHTVQTRDLPHFAVDLGSVSYLSSADFGVLISLKRRIDARKGKLVLFQVNSFVVDTLNTMRLASFFPITEDLQAALALLGPTA